MKLKNAFRSSSIFTKISIMTAIVIISISAVSTVLLVSTYSNRIQKRDRLLVQEAANKLYTFFQDSYNNMYNQRTYIHSSGNIADMLAESRQNPSSLYELEPLHKITDYLTALTYSDSSIEDVILFTSDGFNVFSYTSLSIHNIYSGYDFNNMSYIQEFQHTPASIMTIYDSEPAYLSAGSSTASRPTISFILKIYDQLGADNRTPIGYMIVNYSFDDVNESFYDINKTSDGDYFVLNNQSDVIYSNTRKYIGNTFHLEWAAEPDILFRKTIGLSGIEIIGSLSNHKLKQTTRLIIQRTSLITGAGLLCMIAVIFLLHRHYAQKFHRLTTAMRSISTADFSIHLPVDSQDELGRLSESFNRMSQTLNDYIDKTYLAETQRRTAELYALRAQINPHFLTNTIESIRMCALENDDYESSEMLKELGHLFRWMIQFDQDIICIENELEYVESYLDLMKFRLTDKLSVHLNVPSDIYSFGIPRFTLQPILENALSHGIPNNRPLILDICFSVQDHLMKITITDNGVGIKEDELIRLNEHIHGTHSFQEFGVPLRNIHSRITLLFGTRYGLTICSKYGQGTSVTITLPAKEKGELEKDV